MEEKKEPQISYANIFGLVAVSIFFDVIELLFDLIPVLGWIINLLVDIFAGLTFYVWFKILGVSFFSTRKWLSFASGFILGAIPFTSWFAWTLDVILVIVAIRGEEVLTKTPLGIVSKAAQGMNRAGKNVGSAFKINPAGSGGNRLPSRRNLPQPPSQEEENTEE